MRLLLFAAAAAAALIPASSDAVPMSVAADRSEFACLDLQRHVFPDPYDARGVWCHVQVRAELPALGSRVFFGPLARTGPYFGEQKCSRTDTSPCRSEGDVGPVEYAECCVSAAAVSHTFVLVYYLDTGVGKTDFARFASRLVNITLETNMGSFTSSEIRTRIIQCADRLDWSRLDFMCEASQSV